MQKIGVPVDRLDEAKAELEKADRRIKRLQRVNPVAA